MEELGSEGLDELVVREKDGWFKDVDCVCISDNYWLNTRTPALTYGLRGLMYFTIHVSGPARDLHSGVFGRTVHEPMTDLISLMSRLVDPQGNILIPGVDDMVSPADAEERVVLALASSQKPGGPSHGFFKPGQAIPQSSAIPRTKRSTIVDESGRIGGFLRRIVQVGMSIFGQGC
ncbi:hypothetical protein DFH06DRAFT_1372707 [Mycena polygramma]|nr:hypothetical protein DFH06DRAFT_1372707 [Mycena polygramma]